MGWFEMSYLFAVTLYDRVAHVVAQGHVVALAAICLLQYITVLYFRGRSRTDAKAAAGELLSLECELNVLEKDHTLAQLENQILREFLGQTDLSRALSVLMRRLVPNTDEGFAIFLDSQNPATILAHRGLSEPSLDRMEIDGEFASRALNESVVELSAQEVQRSALWSKLAGGDRSKVRRLFLLGLGTAIEPVGLLVTTDLFPARAHRTHQYELAVRLVKTLADTVRHKQELEHQQTQLRASSEMLELRSIMDRRYDSPMKMVEEFLRHLAERVGADRAGLYLHTPEGVLKPLVRAGSPQSAGVRDQWQRHELTLAVAGISETTLQRFDTPLLCRIGVPALLGSALTIPLSDEDQPEVRIGTLCLSRSNRDAFTSCQEQLAEWAGEQVARSLFKLLNQQQVEQQAKQDGLTQLANRRTFDLQIAYEIQYACSSGNSCSLLMLDLDRFKSVNDTCGHRTGDLVLKMVAQVLRDKLALIRSGERSLAARYGGEELAVLLPGIGLEGAQRIAESLRLGVEALRIETASGYLQVTTSIGVACCPVHAHTVEELISGADAALYQAKSSGRNCVCVVESAVAVQ